MMKKWIKRLAYLLLAILLLLIILLVFFVKTNLGLRTAIKIANWNLPGKLSFTELNGNLIDGISTQSFTYTDELTRVHGQNISIKTNPWLLFNKKFDFRVHWKKLSLDHNKVEQGSLSFYGSLKHYQAELKTIIHGQDIPKAEIDAALTGNEQQAKIKTLEIHTLNGVIRGEGHVKFNNSLTWNMTATASNINPGEKWHDWPGNINTAILANGTLQPHYFHIQLQDISGNSRGFKLLGHGDILLKDQALTFKDTSLDIGSAKFFIDGGFNKAWHATWKVNIPNLYVISPYSYGQLESSGTITGKEKTPIISGKITGSKILFNELQIQSLSSAIQANLEPGKNTQFNLDIENLVANQQTFNSIHLNTNGTTENHFITLNATLPRQTLSAKIHGDYKNAIWNGNLTQLNIDSHYLGKWHLENNSTLKVTNSLININPIKIVSDYQSVTAQYNSENDDQQTKLSIENFKIEGLDFLLPHPLKTNIKLNAKASFIRKNLHQSGSLQASLSKGTAAYHHRDETYRILFPETNLATSFKHKNFNFTLKNSTNTVNVEINKSNQKLSGNIHLKIPDLQDAEVFAKDTDELGGQIRGDMAISGTADTPNFKGQLKLDQFKVVLEKLGVRLNHGLIHIKGNGSQTLALNASLNVKSKNLAINGELQPSFKQNTFNLKLKGKDVKLLNTPEYQLVVSPDMEIKLNNKNELRTTGTLEIPKALIKPISLDNTVTMPSNVNYTDEKSTSSIDNYVNLNIKLGPSVHVILQGLNTYLIGNLNLIDEPGSILRANGYINTHQGTYSVFGKTLQISKGQLIYAGNSITNPGLNISATKTISSYAATGTLSNLNSSNAVPVQQNVVVGVKVTGTLNNPKVALFSEPGGMSQNDILSYLLFGYPQSNTSGNQNASISQAITAINMASSSPSDFQNDLKESLGLSTLDIESSQQINAQNYQLVNNTSLVLGKYLTHELYLAYSIGLVEPINILSLRYYLNKHWSVQGSNSSIENGADVFYTFSVQ